MAGQGVDVRQAARRPGRTPCTQSVRRPEASRAPAGAAFGAGSSGSAAVAGPGAGWLAMPSVCGKVARALAAGELGMNSGPFWPQAARVAAHATRERHLTRICEAFNMRKL